MDKVCSKYKLNFAYGYAKRIAFKYEKVEAHEDDLVQNVMMQLIREIDKIHTWALGSWINKAMWGIKVNEFKAQSRQKRPQLLFVDHLPSDDPESDHNSSALDIAGGTVMDVESQLDLEVIKAFVATPWSSGREKVALRAEIFKLHLEGYGATEISKKVGVSFNSVWNYLDQTKKKVLEEFPEII
jgi:DNA-directed RNA polymerase specialized sigma24 family protein